MPLNINLLPDEVIARGVTTPDFIGGFTGYQAGQAAGRGLSPDQQHRCEHRQRQYEQPNRRDPDEAHGVARANKEPGREPNPRQPRERRGRRHSASLPRLTATTVGAWSSWNDG